MEQSDQRLPLLAESESHEQRVALVHILTPEFQGLDPTEFADIPEYYLKLVHPNALRQSLLDVKPKPQGVQVTVRYSPDERNKRYIQIAVSPEEFPIFSRSITMLGSAAFAGCLNSRDSKLQKDSPHTVKLRARSNEDLASANRARLRAVMRKRDEMESHIDAAIIPRIITIERFREMTSFPNLNRGHLSTVSGGFDVIRSYVFDDMLDAIGHVRSWSEEQAALAKRTLQAALYVNGSSSSKAGTFRGMLDLSGEYYAQKLLMAQQRVQGADDYIFRNQDVVEDIVRRDAEKASDKEK